MRKDITLVAEPRETRGKNAARRLRVAHKSPAVLYGGGEPLAVTVSPKEVTKILMSPSSYNTIFNLEVQGQVTPVIIIDWQTHPIKGNVLHVDLKRVDLNKKMVAKVPVVTTGDPHGVKLQGGHYELVNREVEIETLPDEIPENFTIDVAALKLNESVRAKDIPMTGSMRLMSDPELVISHVVSLREEAAAEAGPAEPEVAKKGKKEEPAAKAAKSAPAKSAPAKAAAPAKKK
ncbi:MAG: 50S ribosomal protein L25 [Bryobacter sp.]|jgi:large subunit ribosomal protein L25|nr:50S ribosomal protein L25 [Bryobacter sp. CoA8 C33]